MHCALQLQANQVAKRLQSSSSRCILIERSFDDTPAHVNFGALAEIIAPFGRYVVPDRWRSSVGKAFAEYKDMLNFGIPISQHGIVDLVAQHMLVEGSGWGAV